MKRLIPVIHYLNDEQVYQNIETCLAEGIGHVFLINHLTDNIDLLRISQKVKQDYPNLWVGLNFLDLTPVEVLGMDLPFDALWLDQTLTLTDIENQKFKGEIFSGLNFKYQRQASGEDLVQAVALIQQTSTCACSSGAGTGIPPTTDKIKELKNLLGDFPLAIASGVSEYNIESYLPYVDDFLVASSITGRGEIIDADLLKKLMGKFYGI